MKPYHSTPPTHGQTRAGRRSARTDPFWDLVATARQLHAPGGCAWDRTQTLETLFPHLLEEVWEVYEAIRCRQRSRLQDELGDVLYTVLFLTLIGERHGWCDLTSLLEGTRRKMIRRHPHVFGAARAGSAHEAYLTWQRVKRKEPRSRSRGKALRPLLMQILEALWTDRTAARRLQQLLKSAPKRRSKRTSRSSSRSNGRPKQRPYRS